MESPVKVAARRGGGLVLATLATWVACSSNATSTGTPTGTLTALHVTPAQATLAPAATQQFAASGEWSDGGSAVPAVSWSATGGTIGGGGLYTAGSTPGTYRVVATQQGGSLADTAAVTITPASGASLFTEGFEDGSLGSRGWFDATSVAVASDARPGSAGTHALQWHWAQGTVAPQGSSRHDFTPTNAVYLSYWVKFSSNWVGSGQDYHPHLFHFLTTADDHYIGPSITHLSLYDELLYLGGNLIANEMIQDALMIDAAHLNQDLRGVTEQRSIGGYNGQHESSDATSTVTWDLYQAGPGQYTNYKIFTPRAVAIAGAAKNSWHHVESYWRLNTVSGGIGQQDGVMQYWVDGTLLIDRHDVYYRTGANPTMQFRTFVMAPYIGSGSPADQYIWVDDLTVGTARP